MFDPVLVGVMSGVAGVASAIGIGVCIAAYFIAKGKSVSKVQSSGGPASTEGPAAGGAYPYKTSVHKTSVIKQHEKRHKQHKHHHNKHHHNKHHHHKHRGDEPEALELAEDQQRLFIKRPESFQPNIGPADYQVQHRE